MTSGMCGIEPANVEHGRTRRATDGDPRQPRARLGAVARRVLPLQGGEGRFGPGSQGVALVWRVVAPLARRGPGANGTRSAARQVDQPKGLQPVSPGQRPGRSPPHALTRPEGATPGRTQGQARDLDHVLENCTVFAHYSEKSEDLKNDIGAVLATAGEPRKPKKEELGGKMRRLIETVVNTYVFSHQRHQYKQKSQTITAFQGFTKLVALLRAEATTPRDLYAKLSITEHDDPRNVCVNSDKAMFQTRYNQILAIETAIKGRIPP